jgi:hypothetical protein
LPVNSVTIVVAELLSRVTTSDGHCSAADAAVKQQQRLQSNNRTDIKLKVVARSMYFWS